MASTIELPRHKSLYYGGAWHDTKAGQTKETFNPGNGRAIGTVSVAGAADVDAAARAAHKAFLTWRHTAPSVRARKLREAAGVMRQHAEELALLDAFNTGNPVHEMLSDANVAAASMEYFAGLVPMLKGETIPLGDDALHYTVREPLGVVARIVAYNHPVMFAGAKLAAPIAAGNTVIIKPPDQAPLSCLRLAELLGPIFPEGVLNVLPGSVECGQALSTHRLIRKVTLIGSVPTGKAIARAAADTLKPTLFELGGKNALIGYPDADFDKLVDGVTRGMNWTWASQSCGSMSRVFLHESVHDRVLEQVVKSIKEQYSPGVPTDMKTTMGPVISQAAYDRVMSFIDSANEEGAELICGGKRPEGQPEMEGGYFIEPTIYAKVKPEMRIAREEIFGPVMSVFKWTDEEEMLRQVNDTEYGLTAAIYTKDLKVAHAAVKRVEAGFVWVNQVGKHFLGVPFGGIKESGGGREECLEELLSFSQTRSINICGVE